jgi:hypothetical protein
MPGNMERFSKHFGLDKGVEHVEFGGNHFILLNSMAMEGDNCRLCARAVNELNEIADKLQCARNKSASCRDKIQAPYSRPIIMQHFPLYR